MIIIFLLVDNVFTIVIQSVCNMIRQKYTLDGWPSTRDCIAWSEDDTIAVALTDKIEILVNTSRKPLIKVSH